jgi:hypothetical protein
MTALWLDIAAAVLAHPVLAASAAVAAGSGAWTLHLRSLRRRERDLLGLVDQRTKQWQDEAHAHARLRQQVTALSLMADRLLLEAVESAGECACDDRPAEGRGASHPAASPEPGSPAHPRSSVRVLVVESRPEQRGSLEVLFDGFGVSPVFADSAWAGAVAAGEARGEGTPYDLVLVGPGMDRVSDDAVALPEPVDQGLIADLLSGSGPEAAREGSS